MSVTALEVLVNGEKLYVVGMEGWQMLGASVDGHKFTPAMVEKLGDRIGDVPKAMREQGMENLSLHCFVGLPGTNRPGSSAGQTYGTHTLAVGDEVTIRVIKTEQPDLPSPPKSGPSMLSASGSPDDDTQ